MYSHIKKKIIIQDSLGYGDKVAYFLMDVSQKPEINDRMIYFKYGVMKFYGQKIRVRIDELDNSPEYGVILKDAIRRVSVEFSSESLLTVIELSI